MRRLLLCFALCLSGCSAAGVRCDSHLQPINPPGSGSESAAGHAVQRDP